MKDCPNYDRCGVSGHYFDKERNGYVRCECLQLTMNRKALGFMASDRPVVKTPLSDLTEVGIVIEGPLEEVRRHVARAALDIVEEGKTFLTIDAYRLIDVFLEKDEDYDTISEFIGPSLLLIMLGYGDIKNQRLPDCVIHVATRRLMMEKPTWFLIGMGIGQIAIRYNSDMAEFLKSMKRVIIK